MTKKCEMHGFDNSNITNIAWIGLKLGMIEAIAILYKSTNLLWSKMVRFSCYFSALFPNLVV